MFCTKCGTQLPDGSKFCGICGASLAAPASATGYTSASAQMPASSYPAYAVAPAVAKKRTSKVPIAIAALVVAVLAAGFFTGWFGLVPDRTIEVVATSTQTVATSSSGNATTTTNVNQFQYDDHGNRTSVVSFQNGTQSSSASATFDADGFPTSTSIVSGGSTVVVSAVPLKDSSGRVVSATYSINNTQIARASFEYEGSTDNIIAITYAGTSNSGMSSSQLSTLLNTSAVPFMSYAASALLSGDEPTRLAFASDGRLLSYTRGDDVVPVTSISRDARKSQTINTSANTTATFDDRGYTENVVIQYDDGRSSTTQYERKEVRNPSRWAYSSIRLYS